MVLYRLRGLREGLQSPAPHLGDLGRIQVAQTERK
ncbi:hypothetical protein chiPu_0020284, partial [Chiloscyllium punctatum]|nr:hypothetical protein [Chiloscyllium punctatum]